MTGLRLREEGLRRERLASEHLRGPGLLEERSRHGFIWKWSQTGFTAEESGAQRDGVTCLRSHSWRVAELLWTPRSWPYLRLLQLKEGRIPVTEGSFSGQQELKHPVTGGREVGGRRGEPASPLQFINQKSLPTVGGQYAYGTTSLRVIS